MKRILLSLLFPVWCFAQTAITIQNGDFSSPVSFSVTGSFGGYESGTVPSWTATQQSGIQSLTSSYFTSMPPGDTQQLYVNGDSVSQDLGVMAQPNATYTLSFYLGRRLDGYGANSTANVELLAGSTVLCSTNIATSTLSAGSFAQQSLICPTGATVPSGDLIV